MELDEAIDGGDAVAWLGDYVRETREVLQSMVETASAIQLPARLQDVIPADLLPPHETRRGTVRVFFTRSPLRTVDIIPAHDVSDDPRGQYSGENLAELGIRYQGIEIGDICAMAPLRQAEVGCPPAETSEQVFREAMLGLPPFDHRKKGDGETFKVSETTCGGLTDIHVRIGERHWMLTDWASLSHDEIIALVVDADDRQVPSPDRHG